MLFFGDNIIGMKFIKAFSLLAIILLLVACQMPGSNPGGSEIDSSGLIITNDNIGTISSYGYGTSGSVAGLNSRSSGMEILSYAEPGSNEFKPIVFETSKGTKVIFQNPAIHDVGNGYYFCQIGNLSTIRKEPTVIYEPTGQKDELGNDILAQKTVMIDVERNYWNNLAIIDMNNSTACLFRSLDSSNNFNIYFDYGIFQTDDAFYFVGDGGSSGAAILRLLKSELSSSYPKVREMTNPNVFSPYSIEGASDKAILVIDSNLDLYLIDTEAHLSPSRILPDDYVIEFDVDGRNQDISPFKRYGNWTVSSVSDDYVYSFSVNGEIVGGAAMKVDDGELKTENISYVSTKDGYGYYLELLSAENKDNGVEMIIRHSDYNSGYYTTLGFARSFCHDGEIELSYLPMPREYRASDKFAVLDGKVYWIGNVNVQSGSSICVGDFDTGTVSSTIIPGKPVASSEFSLSPDGSFVYWQYLSDVDVGTYSWNPEKDEYPRLLMTTQGDVHSIINIDTL